MSALPASPGVRVAPGDPGRISAAASWHGHVADQLEYHAGTLSGAAATLASSWEGGAATAYQQLSIDVVAHFHAAAGTSRAAAAALRRYASELERCQREGEQALKQAAYWLEQARTWYTKLVAAQKQIAIEQAAVAVAEVAVGAARVLGALGAAAMGPAQASLQAARAALARAQSDERTARREFDHAEKQLTLWQRRGDQAWQEAEVAAVNATGSLEPLDIQPPPLVGMPQVGLMALSTVDIPATNGAPAVGAGKLMSIFNDPLVPPAMKREWLSTLSAGDVIAAITENHPAAAHEMMVLAHRIGSIKFVPTGVVPGASVCKFLGEWTVPGVFCLPHDFIYQHAGTINFLASAASLVPGLDVVAIPVSLGTGAIVITKDVKSGDYVAAALDGAGELLGGASVAARGEQGVLSIAKRAAWPREYLQRWLAQDIARWGRIERAAGVAGFAAGDVYGQIWNHAHHKGN